MSAPTIPLDEDMTVVIPPSEVRKIIDHTADSILSKPALEAMLLKRRADDPKFQFLQKSNMYYSYYRMRLKYPQGIPEHLIDQAASSPSAAAQVSSGDANSNQMTGGETQPGVPAKQESGEGSPAVAAATPSLSAGAGAGATVAAAPEPKKPSLYERMSAFVRTSILPVPNPEDVENLPQPPPPDFKTLHSVKLPPVFYAYDLDLLKLVALYAASNGRQFLNNLKNREMNNPQFDFLKVTHPHFSTFLQYVESYTQILNKPHALIEEINQGLRDFSIVIEDLRLRGKYSLAESLRREQREKAGLEDESEVIQTIDWHNFVVCETITFSPEEDPYLAEPKFTIEEIEVALAMEDHLKKQAEQEAAEQRAREEAGLGKILPPPSAQPPTQPTVASGAGAVTSYTGGVVAVEGDEPLIVKKTGETAASSQAGITTSASGEMLTACPLCNTMVPVNQLQEHITIELANPEWKKIHQLQTEQKQAAAATVLAQGGATSVATNLARIIQKRSEAGSGESSTSRTGTSWSEFIASMRQEDSMADYGIQQQQQQPSAAKAAVPVSTASKTGPTITGPSVASVVSSTQGAAPLSIRPAGSSIEPSKPSAPAAGASGLGLGQPHAGGPRFGTVDDGGDAAKKSKLADAIPAATAAIIPPTVSAATASTTETAAAAAASNLVPEAKWLSTHEPEVASGGATITVKVPNMGDSKEATEFFFDGRTFEVPITTLRETVGELKTRVCAQLNNMPTNKMKASVEGVFLNKDNFTLAYYNVKRGSVLEVGLRVRGGKKS